MRSKDRRNDLQPVTLKDKIALENVEKAEAQITVSALIQTKGEVLCPLQTIQPQKGRG